MSQGIIFELIPHAERLAHLGSQDLGELGPIQPIQPIHCRLIIGKIHLRTQSKIHVHKPKCPSPMKFVPIDPISHS